MNKSAKSSKSKSPNSKSPNEDADHVEEAARVAEVAWGIAYMNELWKNAYKEAGEEIKANLKK